MPKRIDIRSHQTTSAAAATTPTQQELVTDYKADVLLADEEEIEASVNLTEASISKSTNRLQLASNSIQFGRKQSSHKLPRHATINRNMIVKINQSNLKRHDDKTKTLLGLYLVHQKNIVQLIPIEFN